jgi:hypothetical protein
MIKKILAGIQRIEKKDKHFISDSDVFIQNFDREHPKRSRSQKAETNKHRNIFERPVDSRVKW